MEIKIRKALLSDLYNLAVLKQQVWISTYATDGLNDEFSRYVLSEYSVESVKKSIESTHSLTLVAIYNDNLVGCVEILLSPKSPTDNVEPCIEITTLYILEKFQSRGIGKKLLDESMKVIKGLNHQKIWLSVYYGNEKAIDFYKRQNFSHIGEIDFQLGEEKYKNYLMIRTIEE